MERNLFPDRTKSSPTIYAYKLLGVNTKEGLLKVGFTSRNVKTRVDEQLRTSGIKYEIVVERSAMRKDGTSFDDHAVHRQLISDGFINEELEWFRCNPEDVESAIIAVRENLTSSKNRTLNFGMRPEQLEAVQKTAEHFRSYKKTDPGKNSHFLWNAKMRFGKTFASYQLALEMGWKNILVLTFKPAVQSAWQEDLETHVDFKDWQFISKNGLSYSDIDKSKPFVCFASFQDFLGKNPSTGGMKIKNEWAHLINWDCVIFDEYHYGAWRDRAKDLFETDDSEDLELGNIKEYDESILPITTNHYLYLSGTPFRAIESGEFIEEQIFNWTYSDEQKSKEEWIGEDNPYLSLPRMVMLTYRMPDDIRNIALSTEFNEFDLNEFFSASGTEDKAIFKYESEVQKWLNLIRGSHITSTVDNLKLHSKKPPMPFSDVRLLSLLSHTFWFLPNVASCYAMRNLLLQRQNNFYHDYEIIVAAGTKAGLGVEALPPVYKAMGNPLQTKTITLSCGKLTTGVSVKPWTGILMLRNCSSPETYFQAAFRVQTPWTIRNPDGKSPNEEEIVKKECYVFDFAPNRALNQVADYSLRLNYDDKNNPEQKVEQFIRFLPILAYDGSTMKEIDARGLLDIAMSGTSATLLARRWESALLVNVDNETLSRLMSNKEAMDALMGIEGFRSLNQDIETIINKSEAVNKIKKEKGELTPKEKKELTEEEKEYKNKRKIIQEKLIKFATRIPIFMYLTDYRERSLIDVITQLEPGLFKKVTGLEQKDFELLVSLNVFNFSLMNDAVYKFKRYEDASLEYIGINKHEGEDVGLFSTSVSSQEYFEMSD